MKAKYLGMSFGVNGLTDGKIYDIVEIDIITGAFRVIDDSGEDYLYSPKNPRPIGDPKHPGGQWELVEDDAKGSLKTAIGKDI